MTQDYAIVIGGAIGGVLVAASAGAIYLHEDRTYDSIDDCHRERYIFAVDSKHGIRHSVAQDYVGPNCEL